MRGRVGRGSEASFCILLYQSPLSEMAQSRLQVMRESTDGFVIAEADLALRGPGEVLGTRQTGMIRYKVADLVRDNVVFKSLATWKDHLTGLPQEELDKIMSRWCSNLEYAQA
jgi:ATP-dependent DNA helicase RecG